MGRAARQGRLVGRAGKGEQNEEVQLSCPLAAVRQQAAQVRWFTGMKEWGHGWLRGGQLFWAHNKEGQGGEKQNGQGKVGR